MDTEDPAELEAIAAEQAALTFGDAAVSAPPPVSAAPTAVAQQAEPERSASHLVCIFGVCFICRGFPSDDSSWTCSILGGSYDTRT